MLRRGSKSTSTLVEIRRLSAILAILGGQKWDQKWVKKPPKNDDPLAGKTDRPDPFPTPFLAKKSGRSVLAINF